MADVIEFLERMGRDAQLRHASEAVLDQAMRDARMSPGVRAVLLRGDRAEIEAIAGAESNVCCTVHAPDPDDEVKQPQAALAVHNKVYCVMIYAPTEDDEESDGARQQKAA
jgi:hypothetical protein